MHRLEADSGHLIDTLERTAGACQLLECRLQGDSMVGHRLHRLQRLATRLRIDPALRGTDAFDAPAGQFPLHGFSSAA